VSKRPPPSLARVAIASASGNVNLGTFGAGLAGAAALLMAGKPVLAVAVLALGVLAYGALIGLDLFNPAFLERVHGNPAGLPLALTAGADAGDVAAPELRAQLVVVQQRHEAVCLRVNGVGEVMRASLQDTVVRCGELLR
jgi:hypothetical protein